ncbi:MAG: acyl-CoA dehydrogenase [Myxococcales bacterium]|nr:acyl-CoA dehydrogenase [Myxococcales bacterium]
MAQPLNRYKADLRDFRFLLFEQFRLQDLLGKEPFAEWGEDECNMVIDGVYQFACDVTGPYNHIGDTQGCRIEDGRVKTPDGFKQAWDKLWAAGWVMLGKPTEIGGQGAPASLTAVSGEMLSGSNTAFNMYPTLTTGAAEVIEKFGTERQRKLYIGKMTDGTFAGTMCLTEPQAGSDVGSASTSAKALGDGRYLIKGTKIFISGGDNDLAENIIHLVLARIEGAEKGTKGLSLFIVPRIRVEDDGSLGELNDCVVPSIEHKMGINGSATCVLNFGDEDDCIGELVGEVPHQGMRQMFMLMNFARIGVGMQGLAVAGSAYQSALEYARERKQGSSIKHFKDPNAARVEIIEHPNIKRDLLHMKATVEGIRALAIKLTMHQDQLAAVEGKDDVSEAYHEGQISLLTPLIKAYATDQAFRIAERAIQIFGGHGYLQDHPVEQACRDAKIFSIYEGTNFIQSMDLVGRKLGQGGGKNTEALLGDIQKWIGAHQDHEVLGESATILKKAHEAVGACVMQFLGWFQRGEMARIPLASETFLELMSELVVGWLLLDAASIALDKLADTPESHPDHAFYVGKRYAAVYFAHHVLAAIPHRAKMLRASDMSAWEMPSEAFGGL